MQYWFAGTHAIDFFSVSGSFSTHLLEFRQGGFCGHGLDYLELTPVIFEKTRGVSPTLNFWRFCEALLVSNLSISLSYNYFLSRFTSTFSSSDLITIDYLWISTSLFHIIFHKLPHFHTFSVELDVLNSPLISIRIHSFHTYVDNVVIIHTQSTSLNILVIRLFTSSLHHFLQSQRYSTSQSTYPQVLLILIYLKNSIKRKKILIRLLSYRMWNILQTLLRQFSTVILTWCHANGKALTSMHDVMS